MRVSLGSGDRRGLWLKLVTAGGLVAALIAVAAHAASKPDTRTLEVQRIIVEATPLTSFQKAAPGRNRFGRLEFLGGLVLTSKSKSFGGWSGIALDDKGRRFVAVSDAGSWMTGELVSSGDTPKVMRDVKIGPLLARSGAPLRRQRDRDAEDIVMASGTPENGEALIAFEQTDRIGRFRIRNGELGAPTRYLPLPPEAKRMPRNSALEALTIIDGGRRKGSIVAIAERFHDANGHHTGWMWIGGQPRTIRLKDISGFDITGAAGLPDGNVLVLERRFRWLEGVRMRIRLVTAEELESGAPIAGDILLDANMSHEIDNMEGIAVHRGADGRTVITLVSDDNFNHVLQRTILLRFRLHEK